MEALVRETSRVMRAGASLVISVLLAGGPRMVRAAAPETTAARLEVDTSELGGIGPVIKERLLERGGQVLRDGEVGIGGPSDPLVRVTVRELDGDEPGFNYEIRLVASADKAGASWSETCSLCTEAELVDSVAAELDKVAASIRELEEHSSQPEPPPPVVEPDTRSEPSQEDGRGLPLKAKAGIGVLAVGVVAAGVGVGLVLAPAQPLESNPLEERHTRPPGFAVLAVGGAALVAGAVLLGLGLKERKAADRRARWDGATLKF